MNDLMKKKLEAANLELEKEMELWKQRGLTPHNLQLDNVVAASAFPVISQVLIDAGLITEDEINLKFKKALLSNYQKFRKEVESMMAEQLKQQQRDMLVVAEKDKTILGPGGLPL